MVKEITTDEITTDELIIEINKEAKEIQELYDIMKTDLNLVNGYKSKIPDKEEVLDDLKFYRGIIDNIHIYYKKSRDIRLNKLSKDIKNHCKLINLQDKLDDNIYFSPTYLERITSAFNKQIEEKTDNLTLNKNKYFWMKDSDLNKYEEWPKKLYYLMKYHKLVIEFLLTAFNIEHNFLKATKDNHIDIRSRTFDINAFKNYDTFIINELLNSSETVNYKKGSMLSTLEDTMLIQKLDKLSKQLKEKDKENTNALEEKNKEMVDVLKQKDQEMVDALAEKNQEMTNALEEKNKEMVDALKQKDQEMVDALAEKDQEMTNALAEKDQEMVDALAEKEQKMTNALAEKDQEMTNALSQQLIDNESKK